MKGRMVWIYSWNWRAVDDFKAVEIREKRTIFIVIEDWIILGG